MNRVIVLGAAGQLGRQMVARLQAAARWDVLACDVLACDGRVDITQTPALRDLVAGRSPAWVVNCAALTHVDRCETDPRTHVVNAEAVGHLAEICREAHARLLQISTDYVFDGKAARPYREDDPPAPLNVYARSKLQSEILARRCDRHLIVRTAWLFGPGGRNFIATILERAAAGQPLRVVTDQVGSPSYAVDVADGIARLMDLQAEGTFHVVNAGQASWFELACKAVELAGLDVPVTPIPSAQYASAVVRPAYSVLDFGKYVAATGHQPRAWTLAAADYIHGPLGYAAKV